MKVRAFRTLFSIGLLLVVCGLSACGKTGPLYLPDASPTDNSATPGKTPGETPDVTPDVTP